MGHAIFHPDISSITQGIRDFNAPFQQIGSQATNLAGQLSDPTSQFFQQFRAGLGQSTGQIGINALLAPLQASGGNFANSQFIAGQQRKDFGRRREDFLNRATSQFASGALGQVGGLLNIGLNAAQIPQQLALQREQLRLQGDAQSASFFDFLAPLLGGIAGSFLGPAGAAGGAALGQSLFGSSNQAGNTGGFNSPFFG